jgi:phage baseplate assembly protein W
MTTLAKITEKDWGLSIESQGEVVQGISDINQCIYIILMTVKGTDPLRPDFGCDVFRWIDQPMNVAIANMVKAAADAIRKWEPRVVVTKVKAVPQGDGNGVKMTIEWEGLGRNLTGSLDIKYGN